MGTDPPAAPVHSTVSAPRTAAAWPDSGRSWTRLTRRGRVLFALLTAVVLLPCYWQPRIQAGDLSSHIYNAWLARLIESGERLPGLFIAGQSTNILFDLLLAGLIRPLGTDGAQRAAVTLAVLIFASGAFAFVCAVSGRRAWEIAPCLGVLAYGWVFHMGFFNFYIALGLSFWALALGWCFEPRRLVIAAAILLVAYTAHALPVALAVGAFVYLGVARKLGYSGRIRLLAIALLLLVAAQFPLHRLLTVEWSGYQASFATGADQAWVFDRKYSFLTTALVLLWSSQFIALLHSAGVRKVVSGFPFQITLLTVAAAVVIPIKIWFPGYNYALAFITERLSLAAGVSICGMVAAMPPSRTHRYGHMAIALLFFSFLFQDERALNRLEDRIDRLTAQLPRGAGVVSPLNDPSLQVNSLVHMIDRACVGRCFSYANYEASTAQFRIRATPGNAYVAATYRDSWDLQTGQYVRAKSDPPLLCVTLDRGGDFAVYDWKPGTLCQAISWNVLKNRPAKP